MVLIYSPVATLGGNNPNGPLDWPQAKPRTSARPIARKPTASLYAPIVRHRVQPKAIMKSFARKRAFDVIFSALVVVFLLTWLIPLVALLIKLESKGPTLFKQLRTGKDGKSFYCLKFRSMTINAEADVAQAIKNDSRITRLGAFLRQTSIDELPQFINVLKGEMSIVGPRPHMILHTEKYSKAIHNFMDRHLIMPGITGLAQVSGHRGETKEVEAMAKRVNADIHYLHNWSFWLDVKIVLLTVVQVFKRNENAL